MHLAFGDDKGHLALIKRVDDVPYNHLVARFVCAKFIDYLVERHPCFKVGKADFGKAWNQHPLKSLTCSLLFGADFASDWSAQHVKRAIESIGPFWGGRKAVHPPGRSGLEDTFELRRRCVVALVA